MTKMDRWIEDGYPEPAFEGRPLRTFERDPDEERDARLDREREDRAAEPDYDEIEAGMRRARARIAELDAQQRSARTRKSELEKKKARVDAGDDEPLDDVMTPFDLIDVHDTGPDPDPDDQAD